MRVQRLRSNYKPAAPEEQKNALNFIAALKRCWKTRDLESGKRIHQEVMEHGFESNVDVSNALIEMYRKCRSIELAREVFQRMVQKNVVTWTCLIMGYVENGKSSVALDLFNSMDCEPNHVACIAALKSCTGLANERKLDRQTILKKGMGIHEQVKERGFDANIFVANTLVEMYSKCGSIRLAREIFDGMASKNVVTWTCLILGYVENGECSIALDLFFSMDSEPNHVTYIAALKACTGLASEGESQKQIILKKGMAIHDQVKKQALDSNILVATTLVDMYSKCGDMQLAREVFERMVSKNVVTWNCLILGYAENGHCSVALQLFNSMDCEPNHVTFLAVLKACTGLASARESNKQTILEMGMAIHEQIKERVFHSNIAVASALVDMYSKCGNMRLARELFERMVHRDAVTWTSLILGYVENGECSVALDLFNSMECQPDHVTYVAALKACAGLASEKESEKKNVLQKGIAIHEHMKECGMVSNILVESTLVDMYSKCGSMQASREVFERMIRKDVVTWNCLILGYVENGECSEALGLFATMDCEPNHLTCLAALKACIGLAKSDKYIVLEKGSTIHQQIRERGFDSHIVVSNALVDMYSKCGNMGLARDVFERMVSKDVYTWTSLIHGYVDNGESSVALDVFSSIECEPDHVTYVAVLKACASLSALPFGRVIHSTLCKLGLENEGVVASVLVHFYSRCGCIQAATEVFNIMRSPDITCWSSLIAGYSSLGDSSQVFSLAKKVKEAGLPLDGIIFLCILTACSHTGMVKEGKMYFESMQRLGIMPTVGHYTCMVDMLGRANRLEEAISIINSMPFKANEVTWRTVLDACRKWNNEEVSKVAFDALVSGDKRHSATAYLMMGDIYGAI